LAATVLWLVSVSLCSTGVFAETLHTDAGSGEHTAHSHGPADDHGSHPHDGGCACASFKAFPAQTAAVLKAPAPSMAVFHYAILLEKFAGDCVATAIATQDTGPPGRISFAELILRQCRLSHAPPPVV
jgi:hypothetical protein